MSRLLRTKPGYWPTWPLCVGGLRAQSRVSSGSPGPLGRPPRRLEHCGPRTRGEPFPHPGHGLRPREARPRRPSGCCRGFLWSGVGGVASPGAGPEALPCALPTANVALRHKPRARDRGGDRGAEASVRHLGEHGQRGQPNGEHRRAREDPGENPPGTRLPGARGHQTGMRLAGDLRRPSPTAFSLLLRLWPPFLSGDGGDVRHPPGPGLLLRVPRADQCQGQR